MYAQRFLFTAMTLLAALLVAAGGAVFHWATFGTPDPLETPGIAMGLLLILGGCAAVVAAGQRLEGPNRRIAGLAIGILGLVLVAIGRLVGAGDTSSSGILIGGLLMTIGAYLIALDSRRYWPVFIVAVLTIPELRYGEYAALAGMPAAGWIAGATVGLVTVGLRRVAIARVGLAMAAAAAALLIASPAASDQSPFSSPWLAIFASLLWLSGWAFTGFAVTRRWPALPLLAATGIILVGAVLEGPIPLEEGWLTTFVAFLLAALVVPGLTAATYLIGSFFGRRVALANEPSANGPTHLPRQADS